MKKTITAHICGIVFTFEEDAYQLLENYLAAVEMRLGRTADAQEIITDIEGRVAELCTEYLQDNGSVVTVSIITQITEQLGDPSVFGQEVEEDAMSGDHDRKNKKRFFRHPTDNMIGGVCGGIAAYANVDPVWIRIGFVVATATFGFGLPLYILLWIVVPEAKTTAEKLQMQGEDINIESIKKKVTDEKEEVKKRWNKFNQDVKDQKWSNNIERIFFKIISVIGSILTALFKALGGVLSFAFFIVGLVLILAILSLITGQNLMFFSNGTHLAWWNYDNFSMLFFNNDDSQTLFLTGCIIMLAVPCAALVMMGAKLMGGVTRVPKEFKFSLIIAFVVGIIIVSNAGINIAKDFNTHKSISQSELLAVPSDTLVLDILPDYYFSDHEDEHFDLIQIDQDQLVFGYPLLDIQASDDNQYHLVLKKRASGFYQKEAINRAQNIEYQYQLKNNLLLVQPFFTAPLDDKWRNQKLRITLEIPIGKVVKLNPLSDRVIYDIQNTTNTLDRRMVNHHWQMTTSGLTCLDCQ